MTELKKPTFLETLWQAGGEVYEVGGTVRDRLLKHPHKDKDLLIRNLSLPKLQEFLKPYGKLTLVGKSFGILKLTPHQTPETTYDIALPRKEKSTGVGHRDFEILFDPKLPLEEDLNRRDFTINAMAFDLKSETLIDPLKGSEDLQNKMLRQVFPKAFEEDPLRLVRAIQFAARFSLSIEAQTKKAMEQYASLIQTVSEERIIEEIRKLFLAKKPSYGFILMQETKLLTHLFPELEALIGVAQDKRPGDDVFSHTLRVLDAARSDAYLHHAGDLDLLFAALFHDCGKAKTKKYDPKKERIVFYGHQIVSKKICHRWLNKMKATTIGIHPENIEKLVLHHMFETKSYFTDKAIRRFIQKIGVDLIPKLLDLRLADNRGGKHPRSIKGVLKMRERVEEILSQKPPFGPKDLALTGHDLLALGIKEGPEIGNILKQLVEVVLDDPTLNTKEHLLALTKNRIENTHSIHENKSAKRST